MKNNPSGEFSLPNLLNRIGLLQYKGFALDGLSVRPFPNAQSTDYIISFIETLMTKGLVRKNNMPASLVLTGDGLRKLSKWMEDEMHSSEREEELISAFLVLGIKYEDIRAFKIKGSE